ncbi:RNA-directed DNA polymerase from mobile element jockey-like [Brachionus plicatilis]|uniref:RNA-directed DNA polymerase from mobile element jockey-like n=1 Tax=Brachionus plicatilis TaxID=10195 RepID=A0A3M7T803_BRAPC|nr:RNA-directed DNA polymerase from mobile element jockey-like [Brachionus plicatilis]
MNIGLYVIYDESQTAQSNLVFLLNGMDSMALDLVILAKQLSTNIKDQYRTVCLKLKKSLRQARLKYELNIISLSKHNPKLIYSYVKSQRKLPTHIRSLIHPQGNTITDMPKILTMISAETGSRLTLEEIKTEKDLGVYFSSDLKWRTHCQHSAAKANSILGQLHQAFHAWNPQSFNSLRADVRIIENIQRRATKLLGRIRDRSYQDRLAVLNLTTLESRRSRGDLISHYKIANGLLDVNWLASTKLMSSIACHGPANAIRGHKKRLFVQLSNCPARTNFLNNRVASTWTNLAFSTVNAPTLNSLKAHLDIHLAHTNTTTT